MSSGNWVRLGGAAGRAARRGRIVGATVMVLLGLGAGVLAGCGSDSDSKDKKANSPAAPASASADEGAEEITMTDAKVAAAESGSVSVYGTIVNGTSADLSVVSATSPISDKVELVEPAASGNNADFKAKKDGFAVAARGKHELKPNGDQIRLTDIKKPIVAGEYVIVVLTFSDKSTLQFSAVAEAAK